MKKKRKAKRRVARPTPPPDPLQQLLAEVIGTATQALRSALLPQTPAPPPSSLPPYTVIKDAEFTVKD